MPRMHWDCGPSVLDRFEEDPRNRPDERQLMVEEIAKAWVGTGPLQHSFKTLRREWRSGELRLIAAALVVAVAAVTAVTLLTDGVRQAMVLRANTLLAADLALDSSFPIAEPYLEEARRLGSRWHGPYGFAACW